MARQKNPTALKNILKSRIVQTQFLLLNFRKIGPGVMSGPSLMKKTNNDCKFFDAISVTSTLFCFNFCVRFYSFTIISTTVYNYLQYKDAS